MKPVNKEKVAAEFGSFVRDIYRKIGDFAIGKLENSW